MIPAMLYNAGTICIGCGVMWLLVLFIRYSAAGRSAVVLFCAVGYSLYAMGAILASREALAVEMAAIASVFWWLWWTNGGGKNTKRRLKKARKFLAVRRTAPQPTG